MLNPEQKLAILFHDQLGEINGKMGHGVLRYTPNPVACVIDHRHAGKRLHDVVDYGVDCPVVGNVAEAAAAGAGVIVLGMSPSGGRLPPELLGEMDIAIDMGLCIVNGLHERLAERATRMAPGQWIWDIRVEPDNLPIGGALAAGLDNRRLLMIGTDMAIGKMTAGLEINRVARERGIDSVFLATGQIGITISGRGVPLDAVRVDYACGAIENLVLSAPDAELAIIEGQGSLLHPGSTSTMPLIRGSCPTHMVLCHRAGARHLFRDPKFIIPPLDKVIRLYEDLTECAGAFSRARTCGVALNTYGMDEGTALDEIRRTEDETGLPATDLVRFGADKLVDAVMA